MLEDAKGAPAKASIFSAPVRLAFPVRLHVEGGRRPNGPIGSRGPTRRSPCLRSRPRCRVGPSLPAASLAESCQTGNPTMKPTIGIDSAVTTLVSVFTLRDSANQPKLATLLQEGVELYSKIQEGGMIATVFLKSRDR